MTPAKRAAPGSGEAADQSDLDGVGWFESARRHGQERASLPPFQSPPVRSRWHQRRSVRCGAGVSAAALGVWLAFDNNWLSRGAGVIAAGAASGLRSCEVVSVRAAVYTLVLVSLLSEVKQARPSFTWRRGRLGSASRRRCSLIQAKLKASSNAAIGCWSRAKRTHSSSPAWGRSAHPFATDSARPVGSWELDLEAARKALEQVIRDVGDLPLARRP